MESNNYPSVNIYEDGNCDFVMVAHLKLIWKVLDELTSRIKALESEVKALRKMKPIIKREW